MSSIRFHSAVLFAREITTMTVFYRDVLQQQILHDFGACMIFRNGLSLWQLGEELKIAKKLGYLWAPEGNRNLELCFETEDFPAAVTRLRQAGVTFVHEEEEEPWGQYTVRLRDPEGNLLELGESLRCFLTRMLAEGMSIAQVSAKTGVPAEQIPHLTA